MTSPTSAPHAAALDDFAGINGVSVFGAAFDADRCRAEPVAIVGSPAALALACDVPGIHEPASSDMDGYTELLQGLRFGPLAFAARAVVFEHRAGGGAGVLVIAPAAYAAEAEALARRTAEGTVARRVSAPVSAR